MKRSSILLAICLCLAACSGSPEQRAQSYYDHGEKLLAANDTTGATIEFKNAIKTKKDFLPPYRALAQLAEKDHHWNELVPLLRTIVDLDPKDVDTKLKLARLMLLGNATDQAQRLISGIDDPNNAALLAIKAAIAYKLKDGAAGLSEAQAALKIDPTNLDATMLVASDRLQKGDPQGALKIIDDNKKIDDANVGIDIYKLKIYQQLGDLQHVESILRRLVELNPQEPILWDQLIKFYVSQQRLDDAETALRKAATANPKNSVVALNLARFLYATKGPDAARAELNSRIAAGGDVFVYQMALAELEYNQKNDADSFKLLESVANNAASPEQAAAARIRLAELNFGRKNSDAALAITNSVLGKDARNGDALKLRATIEIDRNQLEPAINDLRVALNDQPRSGDVMILLASAYERNGSIELAEKQYADALQATNFNARVGLAYVEFLRRRGSIQRADDVLTNLVDRQPNNAALLSALAELKLSRRDFAAAEKIGETLKRTGGNNTLIADRILGSAFGGEQKFDQSIAAFQDAVTAAPSAILPMANLVQAFVQAKQPEKAVAVLQNFLKSNPTNAEALVMLGSVQQQTNAPDEAVKSFQAAIEKQPNDVNGYRALSSMYLLQKKTDAALATVRAGIKQQPDDIVLHMTLASIFEVKGDYDDAIAEYEYVLSRQPGSLIAANNLASMLVDHHSDQASLDRAKTLAAGLAKSPIPQFKDTLGWVNYRLGDLKAAVPLLQDASNALPNVALIHYHLGMSYLAAGDSGKATAELKAALTKNPSSDLVENINAGLKKASTQ